MILLPASLPFSWRPLWLGIFRVLSHLSLSILSLFASGSLVSYQRSLVHVLDGIRLILRYPAARRLWPDCFLFRIFRVILRRNGHSDPSVRVDRCCLQPAVRSALRRDFLSIPRKIFPIRPFSSRYSKFVALRSSSGHTSIGFSPALLWAGWCLLLIDHLAIDNLLQMLWLLALALVKKAVSTNEYKSRASVKFQLLVSELSSRFLTSPHTSPSALSYFVLCSLPSSELAVRGYVIDSLFLFSYLVSGSNPILVPIRFCRSCC